MKNCLPLLLLLAACGSKKEDTPNPTPTVQPAPITKEYSVSMAYVVTVADSSRLGLAVEIDKGISGPIYSWSFNKPHLHPRRDSLEIYHYQRTDAALTHLYAVLHINTYPRLTAATFAGGTIVRLRVYVNGILQKSMLVDRYNGPHSYPYTYTSGFYYVNWSENFDLDPIL